MLIRVLNTFISYKCINMNVAHGHMGHFVFESLMHGLSNMSNAVIVKYPHK